jgi:hypothetical protein
MNKVHVDITAEVFGQASIYPFAHDLRVSEVPIYVVPAYKVLIAGDSTKFRAVRFGLQYKSKDPSGFERTRICDCGLWRLQKCFPMWNDDYSPHSFSGGQKSGAWVLKPKEFFYIHEGVEDTTTGLAGSLGCIEIVGSGAWDGFWGTIERLGGGTCTNMGNHHRLEVTVRETKYPEAIYRRTVPVGP